MSKEDHPSYRRVSDPGLEYLRSVDRIKQQGQTLSMICVLTFSYSGFGLLLMSATLRGLIPLAMICAGYAFWYIMDARENKKLDREFQELHNSLAGNRKG